MVTKIEFDKCYLVTRPRKYYVNGVTITVTPVYDGKQGVDIKQQFEKCMVNNATELSKNNLDGTIT